MQTHHVHLHGELCRTPGRLNTKTVTPSSNCIRVFISSLSRIHGTRHEFRLGPEIPISSLTDFNHIGNFLLTVKLDCPFSLPHQTVNRCSFLGRTRIKERKDMQKDWNPYKLEVDTTNSGDVVTRYQILSQHILELNFNHMSNSLILFNYSLPHFTEAENHSVAKIGRHLQRSSSPTCCSKQGEPEQVGQSHLQLDFEHLQGWRGHSPSGQSGPVFDLPHSKKIFSLHLTGFACISACAHCFLSFHWILLRGVLLHLSPPGINTHW